MLMAPSAFPQASDTQTRTVQCSGKAVTGESFSLSFCYNASTFKACQGEFAAIEILVDKHVERVYIPQEIFVHAEGDRFVTSMKSIDDGLNRYADLEYTTDSGARWNSLRFRLAKSDPKSNEEYEKTFFQSTDFVCGLKSK